MTTRRRPLNDTLDEAYMSAVKPFWISWYHNDSMGIFELHTPWWISGKRNNDVSVCAAVRAESEDEAKRLVLHTYENPPKDLEWRFCHEHPVDWSPFSERFPRTDWMRWEEAATPS